MYSANALVDAALIALVPGYRLVCLHPAQVHHHTRSRPRLRPYTPHQSDLGRCVQGIRSHQTKHPSFWQVPCRLVPPLYPASLVVREQILSLSAYLCLRKYET